MTEHDAMREMSAAYVLGALTSGERARFETHLADCADCQREVASLAPVPGLLARIGRPSPIDAPERVLRRATARVQAEWITLIRSRRRWRLAAAAFAALAIVVGALAWRTPSTDAPAATVIPVVSESISGEVALGSRAWGTAVHLDLSGLPSRANYALWLVDAAGARERAATWGPTPAGVARLDGASSVATRDVVAVLVTDGDGEETLLTVEASDR